MSDTNSNGSHPAPNRHGEEGYGYRNGAGRDPGDRRGYAAKPSTKLPVPKNPGPAGTVPSTTPAEPATGD